MSPNSSNQNGELGDKDREAARRALVKNWPQLVPSSSEYDVLFERLAKYHSLFGADSFELQYNLRAPKDRIEKLTKQFMHGQITEADLRDHFKADAERPIDLEMLEKFCEAYEGDLSHYSGVLQSAALRPSDMEAASLRIKEQAIDEHITALSARLPLWSENMVTVFDFLEELRVTSGKDLVTLGEFEATSAHWLAQLLFSRMIDAWRSCQDISARSYRDPRYSYSANAIDLFSRTWLATFPAPQSVRERLREEFILARSELRRRSSSAKLYPNIMASRTATDAQPTIDNECREHLLLGEMIKVVAQSGHIFRPNGNSDWGIDGEIEFKDRVGNASGRRLYVQLKSGDSYLVRRKSDNEEIFRVKNKRHLNYWVQQEYPVMLVVRQKNGLIRWMDISAYLKANRQSSHNIVFRGEEMTTNSINNIASRCLKVED